MLRPVLRQAMHASAQITAQMDREQVSSESEWATLTQFIEGDRRQQVSIHSPTLTICMLDCPSAHAQYRKSSAVC